MSGQGGVHHRHHVGDSLHRSQDRRVAHLRGGDIVGLSLRAVGRLRRGRRPQCPTRAVDPSPRWSLGRLDKDVLSRVGLAPSPRQAHGHRRGGMVPRRHVANLRRGDAPNPWTASAALPGILVVGRPCQVTAKEYHRSTSILKVSERATLRRRDRGPPAGGVPSCQEDPVNGDQRGQEQIVTGALEDSRRRSLEASVSHRSR